MLADLLTDIAASFLDPKKRVFLGYLLSAFVIAVVWLVFFKKKPLLRALGCVFSKKVWLSRSSKADYQLFLINKVFLLLLSPLFISKIALATIIFYWLHDVVPNTSNMFVNFSDTFIAVIFTLGYFLLDDFTRFYVHRMMHRWPLLWAFHKVHHSAQTMTPMTIFRAHPVEAIIFTLRSTLTQAIAIGGFVYFMGDRADLLVVFGASAIIFIFNVLGSNLRHSHIGIAYWPWLERVFISPAQHQIHHSIARRHWDKNYGVVLAVWDVLFKSHHYSEKNQHVEFGLTDEENTPLTISLGKHSLYVLLCQPVVDGVHIAAKYFSIKVSALFGYGSKKPDKKVGQKLPKNLRVE